MFAQAYPNCRGICPLQAETSKYCKFSFRGGPTFSLDRLVPRQGLTRVAVIPSAIVMVAALLGMNILR